jgi:hypothetical protein
MDQQREAELRSMGWHPAPGKLVEHLRQHGPRLTGFVEHPEVPMDNHAAERIDRETAVGQENDDGSVADSPGRLAAMLFSHMQTLAVSEINPASGWRHMR